MSPIDKFRKFYYYLKKKSHSRLSGGLCCWVSYWFWRLRPEKKKVPVVCLVGCRLRPEKKKVPVVCLAGCQFLVLAGTRSITTGKKKDTGGKFSLRAEKKKVPVICLAGTRSITTGKKRRYRREIFITTGKKSSSRLSDGCVSF